jgi:hypothetical protein
MAMTVEMTSAFQLKVIKRRGLFVIHGPMNRQRGRLGLACHRANSRNNCCFLFGSSPAFCCSGTHASQTGHVPVVSIDGPARGSIQGHPRASKTIQGLRYVSRSRPVTCPGVSHRLDITAAPPPPPWPMARNLYRVLLHLEVFHLFLHLIFHQDQDTSPDPPL